MVAAAEQPPPPGADGAASQPPTAIELAGPIAVGVLEHELIMMTFTVLCVW